MYSCIAYFTYAGYAISKSSAILKYYFFPTIFGAAAVPMFGSVIVPLTCMKYQYNLINWNLILNFEI